MVELAGVDAGRTVTVAVGEDVTVRLPQNGSTGYVWQVADLDGPASVVDDRVDLPGASAPGAGGERRLTVRADAPGTVRLRAVHVQPWQPDTSVTDEYEITLTVR